MAAAGLNWMDNYPAALEAAAKLNKKIFLDISTDG